MLNPEKSKAYLELVQDMLDRYPKYDFNNPENNTEPLYAPYVNEDTFCQEINFYTYWQGLGYAERTPKIKYLFVAQDIGGGPFDDSEATKESIKNLKKQNNGDRSIPYINDDEELIESMTDKNLIKLFKNLGYDLHRRYDDLFFTNFCLGCRRDSTIGMQREWMKKDSDLFKRLYDILEPENIITMGMRTFECVYYALTGKDYPGLGAYNFDNFKKLVSSHKKIFVKRGRNTVPIYPIHHCGKHGIENLIADPLAILIEHITPIKENQPSPFAEYLSKLIDEYISKNAGKIPKLASKILSDLRKGNTNAPIKRNVIAIIFNLKLSADEAYQLLAKAKYTCSKYKIPKDELSKLLAGDNLDRLKCSKNYEEIKFDKICIRYIDKQNFNTSDIDGEFSKNGLDCIFSKK